MRRKKTDPKRTKFNQIGLLISRAYLLLSLGLKVLALQHFKTDLKKQNLTYSRLESRPSPLNTILWTANAEAENHYLIGYYSFFDTEPIQFKTVPKNHHYLGQLKNDTNVKRLIKISEGWYSISKKDGFLYFNDLRFGRLNPSEEDSDFVFSYKLIPEDGTITAEELQKKPKGGKKILQDLWVRFKGNG